MEKILRIIEKIIPKKIYNYFQPFYHYGMALLGAIIYRFPANDLYVIGVTGTKGKSSVTEMVNAILEEAGKKTIVTNTIRFKIDDQSIPNKFKMSMPGRFFLQKKLREAVKAGCTHAVIEMTSEGSRFYRNKFIPLDAFIFTNITPEHIESHGSFEKYLEAKLDIGRNFKKHSRQFNSNLNPGHKTICAINTDDDEADKFLEINYSIKIPYSISDAKPIDLSDGIKMRFKKNTIYSHLDGEFNVVNILAAASLTSEIGISEEHIRLGIENLKVIPGRVQKIKSQKDDFEIVIDYAHTAESLEALYKAFSSKKRICVLGNTGGGRDKWKRPIMAKVAEKYCDEIILTNEDPYDEDPMEIIESMEKAITKKTPTVILDRRSAIKTALSEAGPRSVVLITGKGTDPYIMEANGRKTPWSDYDVALEELKKIR
jgi:UDP-N-acetylmuramoyl-L-alanyl-D-glutamate--2,6-diaminopimelate ligase